MGDEKSLGQIAYEAAAEYNGDVRPWEEVSQRMWEVAAEAVSTFLRFREQGN